MLVKLTPDEVRQAIREWFIRRGIPCEKNDIVFGISDHNHQAHSGSLITDVKDIELPTKEGPYR